MQAIWPPPGHPGLEKVPDILGLRIINQKWINVGEKRKRREPIHNKPGPICECILAEETPCKDVRDFVDHNKPIEPMEYNPPE